MYFMNSPPRQDGHRDHEHAGAEQARHDSAQQELQHHGHHRRRSLFGWILAVEKIPQMVQETILMFKDGPLMLLLILNLFFLLVGMFLDSTTSTLLIIPMLAAPVAACGIDPVHLGLVIIFNLMIGLITPPMGLSLFMVSNVASISMKEVLVEMPPISSA